MSKPQVIEDEEHERIWERVAAAGVAKASGVVCVRAPHRSRPGARTSTVQTVQATVPAVRQLAARLAAGEIQLVTLESTSGYWRIWFCCWRRPGWMCSWYPPARLRTCPAGPRPTSWTRSGWPG